MKRLIITILIILFLFQLSLTGRVNYDNKLSPGEHDIKKTSVSSVTSVAKSNYISGKDKIKIICSPLGGCPRILNCELLIVNC